MIDRKELGISLLATGIIVCVGLGLYFLGVFNTGPVPTYDGIVSGDGRPETAYYFSTSDSGTHVWTRINVTLIIPHYPLHSTFGIHCIAIYVDGQKVRVEQRSSGDSLVLQNAPCGQTLERVW